MNETTNNTENETNDLPAELSYTKDDLARATARKVYREGWYAVFSQSNTPDQNSTGSLRFTTDYVPLKDPTDTDSRGTIKIRDYCSLPIENPKKRGHKVPDTVDLWYGRLRAFGGPCAEGVLEYPRKEDGELTFNGEPIDKSDLRECREQVKESVLKKLTEIWQDPTMMHGFVVFAYVVVDGEYNKIKSIRSELPEDEEVVPPEMWFNHDAE